MNKSILELIQKAKEEGAKFLDLGNCGIVGSIPAEVGMLAELEYLNLGHVYWNKELGRIVESENPGTKNKIESIGDAIQALQNLKYLSISGTQYQRMPLEDLSGLEKVSGLLHLDVSYTEVEDLTPLLNMFDQDVQIYLSRSNANRPGLVLEGCTLRVPHASVLVQGSSEAARVIRSNGKGNAERIREIKVVIVGDREVGKSSLRQRLFWPELKNLEKKDANKTRFFDYEVFGSGNNSIQINLVDFDWHEIIYDTHNLYHSEKSIYVYVYSARQDESTKQQERFLLWLKRIERWGGGGSVIAFLNLNATTSGEQIPVGSGSQNLRVKYSLNGDLSQSQSGDELLEKIIVLANEMVGDGDLWQAEWLDVRRQMMERSAQKPMLAFEVYLESIYPKGSNEDPAMRADAVSLLKDLCRLGKVFFSESDDLIGKWIVLDQAWLSRCIEIVHTYLDERQAKGVLSENDFKNILKGDSLAHQNRSFLLQVMMHFELCFVMTDTAPKKYLFPSLMPMERPLAEIVLEAPVHLFKVV